MPKFTYIATDGSTKTIDAATPEQAISSAPDRAPSSGVQAVAAPPTTAPGTVPPTVGGIGTAGPGTPAVPSPVVPAPVQPGAPAAAPAAPAAPAYPQQGIFGPNAGANAPLEFQGFLQTAIDKLNTNSTQLQQRNLLIKQLYDKPLTSAERASLPPAMQEAVKSGNRPNIEMQLRLINDGIAGRRDTMSQSLEFLTDGYNKSRENMEKQRQDAIANIINFGQQYGSQAPKVMRELYGDEYIASLAKLGIDIDKLTGTSTLAEREMAAVDARARASASGSGGLTANQMQSALNAINDDFRQDPAVKQYTASVSGISTLNAIPEDSTTAADDIAAIYAFAKIMDPESVVREGEYATVQKYAQSWASNFGFNASRIFSNSKFLSTDALKKLKATANIKATSLEKEYEASRKVFQSRIDQTMAGELNSGLPDYGKTGDAKSQIESMGYDYDALHGAYPDKNDDELLTWVESQ